MTMVSGTAPESLLPVPVDCEGAQPATTMVETAARTAMCSARLLAGWGFTALSFRLRRRRRHPGWGSDEAVDGSTDSPASAVSRGSAGVDRFGSWLLSPRPWRI